MDKNKKPRLRAAILACLLCMTMVLSIMAPAAKKVTIKTIKSGTTLQVGAKKSLNVKINTKSSLSYKTSNKKVVTVSKKGKITAKRPGIAKITVTATPKSKKYKKTSKSIAIKVCPATPKTVTAKRSGKSITATVSKVKYANGFQFQYSLNENMSGAKSKTVKSRSYKFNASTDKTYYIRVRSYAKTGGKTFYSSWSGVCTVKKGSSSSSSTNTTPTPTPTPETPSTPETNPNPTPSTECSHSWNSGTITKQPTCVTAGEKKYTCTKCGATKTESIAATGQHSWDAGQITTPASCGKTGVRTYTCTKCGATKMESIPATGQHTWVDHTEVGHYEEKEKIDKISAQVCLTCGKGFITRKNLTLYGHNLTEEEVEAAGYVVADDASTAAMNHCADTYGCNSWHVVKVDIPTHETTWVVDTPAYTQCSVCGATK